MIFHHYSREVLIPYDFSIIQLNWLELITIYRNPESHSPIRFFLITIHLVLLDPKLPIPGD